MNFGSIWGQTPSKMARGLHLSEELNMSILDSRFSGMARNMMGTHNLEWFNKAEIKNDLLY